MTFKQTILWKTAFQEARIDSSLDEQTRLAASYDSMRDRAAMLVTKIAADLPNLTIHNVTHLDALWEMASIAAGNSVDLNPAEAFVFGGAILLHDAAMTLAAFPGGITELRQTVEWRDLHARYSAAAAGNSQALGSAESRATADSLRLLHAKRAEELPKISWVGPQRQDLFLIEDQQIRNFYGPKIGKIAHSHWWPISKIEDELSGALGAIPGITNCTVDLLKVACLLRVADAMHLDQRRAPAFEFGLVQPTGLSADHWKFQERMAKPFVQGDALVYTAQPPFEVDVAEAWWTAFDALQMVDRELRGVDRILRDRQKSPFAVRRVDGVHAPSDLARTVETIGWTPVDSTVRVTDVPKIVATLGGSKLYGSSIAAPVRELMQNGLDAIGARRKMQARPNGWGTLQIAIEHRGTEYWLCVEDNGVGMSTSVLTGPLIDFGNSFWGSSLAIEEFPGLASAGMKSKGRYGIGFFSVFMLGDHVRVITRRYDRDIRSAKVLEFRNGLGSRPNLREADDVKIPLDGGTRVEVKLRINPSEPGGLLHRQDYHKGRVENIKNFIFSIAPASDTSIDIVQNDDVVGSIKGGDWLDIDDKALLLRIYEGKPPSGGIDPQLSLTELRGEDGQIFGRACIDVSDRWYSPSGLITVDGLAANKITFIEGILVGLETTASRNAAQPIVPASVLAAWASEQAIAVSEIDMPGDEKATVAAIVSACGGDLGDLPLIKNQDKWMNIEEFMSAIRDLDEILLHDGEIEFDDDDDVGRSHFLSNFKQRDSVFATSKLKSYSESSSGWIASVTQGSGKSCADIIREILLLNWKILEDDDDYILVGDVAGAEIYRFVTVWVRNDQSG